MHRFIARQNVERYRHMLDAERDPERRAQIQRLLAEAMAELNEVEGRSARPLYPPERPSRPVAK